MESLSTLMPMRNPKRSGMASQKSRNMNLISGLVSTIMNTHLKEIMVKHDRLMIIRHYTKAQINLMNILTFNKIIRDEHDLDEKGYESILLILHN